MKNFRDPKDLTDPEDFRNPKNFRDPTRLMGSPILSKASEERRLTIGA